MVSHLTRLEFRPTLRRCPNLLQYIYTVHQIRFQPFQFGLVGDDPSGLVMLVIASHSSSVPYLNTNDYDVSVSKYSIKVAVNTIVP